MHPVYFLTSAFLLSCVNRSKWHHDSVGDKGRYTNAKANTPQKKSKMRTNLPLASLNGSLRHCPAVQNKSWACQDFAHLQMETNCKYNGRQVHKYTKAQWWEVACKETSSITFSNQNKLMKTITIYILCGNKCGEATWAGSCQKEGLWRKRANKPTFQ